jgi:hypothetical protein
MIWEIESKNLIKVLDVTHVYCDVNSSRQADQASVQSCKSRHLQKNGHVLKVF